MLEYIEQGGAVEGSLMIRSDIVQCIMQGV